MIDEAANPWLPKSPAESFSVWGRDATESDITLVISSGTVMRKQTILELVDPPEEDPPEEAPKQQLKLEYAVEFLNSEQKAVKLSLSDFPVIIGFLDGKIKRTDINLKSFEDLEDDTEEKLEDTLPSGNEGIENPKPEITDAEEADEEENINVPPEVARFIPLRYITCGKDSFNELMLTGAKWIVESNIVLGNNVISSGKNKKPKEDKEASSDECEYGEGHTGETGTSFGGGPTGGINPEGEVGAQEEDMPKAPCQERGEDSGIPVPEGENVPGNVPPINPPANPPPNQPNNPLPNPPANPPPNPPANQPQNEDDYWDYSAIYN